MVDNRRVRMTKRLIKDAYLELLEENPDARVSVTDICERADLNRSTFYAHYEDTRQLRREMERDILEQVPVLIDLPDELSSDERLVDALERFFSYIRANAQMFRVLLLQADNRDFTRRLIDAVLKKYHVNPPHFPTFESECGYIFVVTGAIGLMGAWLEENFPVSDRELASIVFALSASADEKVPNGNHQAPSA